MTTSTITSSSPIESVESHVEPLRDDVVHAVCVYHVNDDVALCGKNVRAETWADHDTSITCPLCLITIASGHHSHCTWE